MSAKAVITPARRALNPVLTDDALMPIDGGSEHVFYTPLSSRIEEYIGIIIAGGAGLCLLSAWLLSLFSGPPGLVNLLTLFAFAIAGVPALTEVWHKVRRFRVDIDLLMVLGALLAAWIGSPFEGALLLFLFALAGAMETHALQRTQSAIVALRDLSPKEATVFRGGVPRRIPLRQVDMGDRVLVRPGELIPIDGVVEAGSSSVSEAAITGESIPRSCDVGAGVFAGTQNLDGRLELRVTKIAADSTLARIVKLVTDARHHPTRAQRLIDRIGPTYSIVVIVAAVGTGMVNGLMIGVEGSEAIRRAIAVLIVASPCALIIATPVAYLSAIAAAARRGVLIKGGSYLETIARSKTVVFDKTGTLTTGRLQLTDVIPPAQWTEDDFLRHVGAIEQSSTHPLAEAVAAHVHKQNLALPEVSNYKSTPGEGVEGLVEGTYVWVGRPDRAGARTSPQRMEHAAQHVARLREEGKTVSVVVLGDEIGLIAFRDAPRPESSGVIQSLRQQGVSRIEMLTGDHEAVARRVSAELSLDGFAAQVSPEEKLNASARMRDQNGPVVLVGDGINDAPALARADAGIAMGAFGAEIAMEAAHVVLMKDRIELVAWLHRHALRTARIVKQNLTLALGVIGVLSLFAVAGEVPLPLAVIGHEGSTVVVALNALRLLKSSDRDV